MNRIAFILTLVCLNAQASEVVKKALTPALNVHEKIIACTILLEARGESKKGQYFVAGVIAQRMLNRGLHPTTICRQRKQFSCWNDGKTVKDCEHLLKTKQATYASLLARALTMSYKNRLLIDVNYTRQADHYYSKKIMKKPPYWAFDPITKEPIQPVAVVGNHVFYKLKK
ncbi:MAG: hypothetical protein CMC15_13595 [Flavobacteriaceae bacterium]|nr:hypothetical protein [Flavobacteriaceae bacterium]